MNKILISHRGNISGPNPERENTWSYIQEALNAGYEVEIDVWYKDGQYWLGHNTPNERISARDLLNKSLWLHCKNEQALLNIQVDMMVSARVKSMLDINFFAHQNDDYVITSAGLIWTYPGKPITPLSIAVLPETVPDWDFSTALGICSDYIERYK